MIAETKTAAIYCRMSDVSQDRSISEQQEHVERWAEQNGYVIVEQYKDEGVSGWKVDERQGFQNLINDAQAGKFRYILLWDIDRFSRFPVLQANHYWFLLDEAGVQIATVNQGLLDFNNLASWLSASITQHGKAEYVKDLSRNILRGKIRTAQNGDWTCVAPMGYRVEKRKLYPGDPRHIETIRRIYRMYADGNSLRGTANALNSDNVKTVKGNNWSADTVRKVLRNPVYVGTVAWNRNSQGRFYQVVQKGILERPSGKWKENDDSDWIVRENMHEALIDRELFEDVRRRLVERRQTGTPHVNGGKFVLTGLLWCHHCGHRMIGRTVHGITYYTCNGYQRLGKTVCHAFNAPQDRLVEVLADHIDLQLLKPANIERLRAALKRGVKEQKRKLDVPGLRRELKKIEAKLEKYTRRLLECDADMLDSVQAGIRQLRADRERLRLDVELAETPEKRLRNEQDEVVERAIERLSRLPETLRNADPLKVRDFFEKLFVRIDLHFDRKPGKKRAKHTLRRLDVAIRPDWFSSKVTPALKGRKPPSGPSPSPPAAAIIC